MYTDRTVRGDEGNDCVEKGEGKIERWKKADEKRRTQIVMARQKTDREWERNREGGIEVGIDRRRKDWRDGTEGCPQRKRPSGDVTLIPPGRAYKMAAGVPFLPCYSYRVGFRLSRSLCLRYMRMWVAAVARGPTGVWGNRCTLGRGTTGGVLRLPSRSVSPFFPFACSSRIISLELTSSVSEKPPDDWMAMCLVGWIERTKESCQRARNWIIKRGGRCNL